MQIHTDRAKEHKAGEDNDQKARGIDYVTTVELEEASVRRMENQAHHQISKGPTKKPSDSQLFNRNISLGGITSTPDQMDN